MFDLGNVEKESSYLSKTDKHETSMHQKPAGFVPGKDIYAVNIPDPPVPPESVEADSSNNDEENSSIPVKDDGNGIKTEPPEVFPTTSDAMKLESDLQAIVPSLSASEELASKVLICQQKPLDSTLNSCEIVEAAHFSDDTLSDSPHGLQITHDGYHTENKLDKSNLKKEAFLDQSAPENPSRDLVIPEQFYIWQYDLSPSYTIPLLLPLFLYVRISRITMQN